MRKLYRFAAAWAEKIKARTLLDIGCGYGWKLSQFLAPLDLDIVGIDGEHAISYCRTHHAFGRWLVEDIEHPCLDLKEDFDVIVSADVIEHLVDPDTLLAYIRRCAHPNTHVVLSPPERDLRRGPESMGPPQNAAHIREWNQAEVAAYLTDRGLNILDHRIQNLRAGMRTCQTVLAQFA